MTTTPVARQFRIVNRHFGRDSTTAHHWAAGDDLVEEQILNDEVGYWTVIEVLPPSARKPQRSCKFALNGRRFRTHAAAKAELEKAKGKGIDTDRLLTICNRLWKAPH